MNLSKKWKELGWKESDGFYSTTFRRVYQGQIQMVCQTPNRAKWRAIRFDESGDNVKEETLHKTPVQALSKLNMEE